MACLDSPLASAANFELATHFVRLCSTVKKEIQLWSKCYDVPPSFLPLHVCAFLQRVLHLNDEQMQLWWGTLKDIVWTSLPQPLTPEDISAFQRYGPRTGLGVSTRSEREKLLNLSHQMFYPSRKCLTCNRDLTEPLRHEAVLFTLHSGAVAAYTTSLYCRLIDCPTRLTRFHPGYSIREESEVQVRTYNEGVPEFIQFEKHSFIEAKLCEHFANEMLLTWSSAINCANLYNLTWQDPKHYRPLYPATWSISFELTGRKVWHAFMLYSLLCDWNKRGEKLELPNNGTWDEQLSVAIRERNHIIYTIGDITAMTHVCDLCCKDIKGDGYKNTGRLNAVVMDGVTLGHACCSVMHCKNPLRSKRERFCFEHMSRDWLCRVKGCTEVAEVPHRSCVDPAHRALDMANKERGQSFFQLSHRIQRDKVSHLTNSVSTDTNIDLEEPNSDVDDQVSRRAQRELVDACAGKSDTGNVKLRAQWNRKQTHNEQLIVRPCGVIVARRTMYGSEGKAEAKNILKDVFKAPKHLPSVIFYDNNCQLFQHIRSSKEDTEFFKDVIMPVDVFHFKSKHKVTDEFCQKHCNPALWPELYDTKEKKWVFNSSVAEQTNAWIGGYHAMLREMNADHYEFFLDEMIRRRNDVVIEKLRKEWHAPFNYTDL